MSFSFKSTLFCRYFRVNFSHFNRSINSCLKSDRFNGLSFDFCVKRLVICKRNGRRIEVDFKRVVLLSREMTTRERPLVIQEEKEKEERSEKRKHETEGQFSQKKKKLRKRFERPGNGDEKYDETSYYFENGLRKVRPYFYTYTTFCKGRWINRKLIDVFSQEFRALPAKEFSRGIELGSITVNSMKVNVDYQLKNGDFIANISHRHEVPVTAQPIKIVHLSDDLLVIDKPSSIPVHPCGRYRHNSVVFILGKEFNFRDIKSIHRLDRLTSGLLIFGRTIEKARELELQIRTRLVEKQYLCRVEGEFPSEVVTCEEPIDVISFKIGICRVTQKGKSCKTLFERLSYNGRSSVVLCKPHTGRMHQIRVHLQFLGYPIVNDPLYNHPAFGPQKGKNGDMGQSDKELIDALIKAHNMEIWLSDDRTATDIINVPSCDSESETSLSTSNSSEHIEDVSSDEVADRSDPNCLECNGHLAFKDPEPKDLVMYLHAWKYKGVDWNFESERPKWADDDWSGDP